jgi:hypothetical protein
MTPGEAPMPFVLRLYQRFPVLFLKLPLAYFSGLGSVKPVEGGLILRWKEISILYGTR